MSKQPQSGKQANREARKVSAGEAAVPARIEKRAKPQVKPALHLAGSYRVIHGRVAIPRPPADLLGPDGNVNPNEPLVEYALAGDQIFLGDEDAYRMLAMDQDPDVRHKHAVVEPLDAKPSRVGKVFEPPKTVGLIAR